MYANWSPSVTWSLLRGSSTGDVSSTNVIPGRKGQGGGEGREGWRKDGQQGRGEHTERGKRDERAEGGRGMERWRQREREVGPYPSRMGGRHEGGREGG